MKLACLQYPPSSGTQCFIGDTEKRPNFIVSLVASRDHSFEILQNVFSSKCLLIFLFFDKTGGNWGKHLSLFAKENQLLVGDFTSNI